MKKLIFILVLLVLLPTISADVISLNAGGTGNIILNPDKFLEGFFFGSSGDDCVPTTCVAEGYACGNISDGCSGTLDCGTCATGYTCTLGVCVADSVTPGDSGGSGGGTTYVSDLTVVPTSFTINLAVNTNKEETIKVTNIGTVSKNVTVGYTGLDDNIILDTTSFILGAGESKIIGVTFVATSKTGVITGSINIGGTTVGVSLNVRTVLLLFDSNIVVLNDKYQVPQKEDLETQVTLIPMGEKQRMDITLNYEIKDYQGKIYLTKSETLLIEEQIEFKRNFDTGSLPLGKYVIGLELIYPNGVAPSSAHFEVIEPLPTNIFAMIIMFLIILILIVLIIVVLLLIKKKRDKDKAQGTSVM